MPETEVQTTDLLNNGIGEARSHYWMESPLINFIVGILIAYVVIYFITFWLGPTLFGIRPYRPWPIYGRQMHHVTRRAADDMNDQAGIDLSARVAEAIHNN